MHQKPYLTKDNEVQRNTKQPIWRGQ